MRSKYFAFCLVLSLPLFAQRKSGNPLDHLPANIEILTHFGERADISPDNQRIAFMDKSFGDAFVIDLRSHIIKCLTCNVPGAAFLRVMHLVSGDYILIGPARFSDIHSSRSRDNELWYLQQENRIETREPRPEDVGRRRHFKENLEDFVLSDARSGSFACAGAIAIVCG
jgi:hypothetical protein